MELLQDVMRRLRAALEKLFEEPPATSCLWCDAPFVFPEADLIFCDKVCQEAFDEDEHAHRFAL